MQDEEKVRVLVVSARIWCALFAFGNSSFPLVLIAGG